MRLLIVEDDLKTARALAAGLERSGFSIAIAHSGEEGFCRLNAETFDLLVLDWMLPGRSGIEILKTLPPAAEKHPSCFSRLAMPSRTASSAWKAERTIIWSSPSPLPN